MLYVNAGDDRIGIGHSSPGVTLDVNGEVRSHHTSDSRFLLEVNDVNRGGFSATTDAGVVIYGASSTNPIRFQTSGSEKARIDTSGRLLVGATSSMDGAGTNLLQIVNATAGRIGLGRNDSEVAAGNTLGAIHFYGNDGGTYQESAVIRAEADGSHANNDKPGRLIFSTTADNGSTPTERVRIDSTGHIKHTGLRSGNNQNKLANYTVPSHDTSEEDVAVFSVANESSSNQITFGGAGSAYNAATEFVFRTASAVDTTVGSERMKINSSGLIEINEGILGRGINDTFTLNGKTQPHYGFNLVGSSSAPTAMSGYYGLAFATDGAEQARIDRNGRLLMGLTSTSSSARAIFEGFGGSPTGQGILQLQVGKNNAATANNENLGSLRFANSDGSIGALVSAEADAQWASSDYPSRLTFHTTADNASSPTERMKIGSNGEINTFSAARGLRLRSAYAAGTGTSIFNCFRSATNTSNGTLCFVVLSNGNTQNTNNSYGAISDVKLKENIVDAASQWEDIKGIRVRKYNFKEETGHETFTQLGVVAQEVETVSPGLVTDSPDLDAEGNDLGTVTKSVNYSVLYMKAVKALQEAQTRIETLESQHADLLARVAALEAG